MIIKAILKPIIDSFFKSIIGATLIVSGLIKANDTIGFSIKLSDYFQDGALAYRVQDIFGWNSFSLEWLMEYSLYLAIFICVLEIVLGFCLIVGARIKETIFLLFSMLFFFLILTLHTATCASGEISSSGIMIQCVSDCGCFGDALKFTPWGSFTKDLILIVLLIISSIVSFELYKDPSHRLFKVSRLNSLFDDIFAVIFSFTFTLIWCIIVSWYFPLLMLLILFLSYFLIKKYYSSEILIVLAVSLISLTFSYYTLNNLPIKDFRPYKIGTDVKADPDDDNDGLLDYEDEFPFDSNNDGTDDCIGPFNDCDGDGVLNDGDPLFDFGQNCFDCKPEFIIESSCGPVLSNECVHPDACNYNKDWINHPDYNPALPDWWKCHFEEGHDLHKSSHQCDDCSDYISVRHIIEDYSAVVLIISEDLHKSEKSAYAELNVLKDSLTNKYIQNFYSFAGDLPDSTHVKNILGGNKYIQADPEMSKMMIRSNPGIILMKNGVITKKWHYNNIPNIDEVLKILKD
tara:strand:- start:233 stop:1780 length:1548 start_codon:yes stop_codon:yes gene_type:complete